MGSLTVTGGQVTLNNINADTIGAATFSGGTTSFGDLVGQITVTSANVSGAAKSRSDRSQRSPMPASPAAR